MTSSGNCLLGFGGNKLYKSFDYGDTWKEFSDTPSNIISVDISTTGKNIFIISKQSDNTGWVYYSDDSGKTWKRNIEAPVGYLSEIAMNRGQ